MSNIITFTKKQYDDCMRNLKIVKEVVMASMNNDDALQLRAMFRPLYVNPVTNDSFMIADAYINGVITGAFNALEHYTPKQMFADTNFPELLKDSVADIEKGLHTVVTIPFEKSTVSIILVPLGSVYIIPDVFMDTASCFQEGIDRACVRLNLSREELVKHGRVDPIPHP